MLQVKPWDARLAAWLIAPLRNTPLQPNHLTTIRLAVGIGGAVLFAHGEYPNAAALLIVLSNFLDHSDGEFARITGRISSFGHKYDLVSDAIVTIGLFVGIGIGVDGKLLGVAPVVLGMIAGAAVAAIFHIRNQLESMHGKDVTAQKIVGGFEPEDVLYLLPIVTFTDGLDVFLVVAVFGASIALVIVIAHYQWHIRKMRVQDRQ